jgi:hypothetical protein
MSLESEEKVKLLDEHIAILKQDLLFLMAERKRNPESATTHNIITIKRELDKAVQQKMSYARLITGISTMA